MSKAIVTLTMNPALDLSCMADAVTHTHKIRTSGEELDPGGGGINVARVIHFLGGEALALIMTGGVTGNLIEELLGQEGVRWRRLPVYGRNRICLNVHDRGSGLEYRFVPRGPEVAPAEWCAALDALEKIEAEWIVASGSLPPAVPEDFYARAARIATRRGQKFVLDTSDAALRAVKRGGLEVLKMSQRELASMVGGPSAKPGEQEEQIASLVREGTARKVAVTLGADGAILGTGEGIVRVPALKVKQLGAVGAGDAFLAGLVLGLAGGMPDLHALAYGNAAGAAAVATYGTARIQRAEVDALYQAWRHG